MVGWDLPTGSTKSHTHTSPSGAAASMDRIRSRAGSASALNPWAMSAASSASRGAASTDGQHCRLDHLDHCTLFGHPNSLLLTTVNVSTMIDASTVVDATRRSPCPECNWP